ncbi:MAG: SOS response-associated peptidase [Chloroflexi bacterium]|nr:SOS response-associated peptidase [Chloroflexota bacterium]
MCGRFTLYTNLEQLAMLFDADAPDIALPPSYNIAPTQPAMTVVHRDDRNKLAAMRWGLIPVWAKDISIGSRMINARAETLGEKASFKRLFKSRRCLVVADGFFEWRKTSEGKIPMHIRLKSHEPFGFAGLYDTWTSPDGLAITSCTIITTAANEFMLPIHDRMPAIIAARRRAEWLDPQNDKIEQLAALLAPYPAREMEAYPVSRLVNSPAHNSPEIITPAT